MRIVEKIFAFLMAGSFMSAFLWPFVLAYIAVHFLIKWW